MPAELANFNRGSPKLDRLIVSLQNKTPLIYGRSFLKIIRPKLVQLSVPPKGIYAKTEVRNSELSQLKYELQRHTLGTDH